jgi:hypothetical protein
MRRTIAAAVMTTAALALAPAANAQPPSTAQPATLAVIGDIPYGTTLINEFPADISEINADPSVARVIHLGDIKNGSTRCDTSYFQLIRSDFDLFEDPLVYTPGDNEWTDCHRANNGGYIPAGPTPAGEEPSRLDTIRALFFDQPGMTLGQAAAPVDFQGDDAPENVRWSQAGVVWATLDVPGSNNDLAPWFGDAESDQLKVQQAEEVATRTAADLRWLNRVFDRAEAQHAAGVAIGIQADMWDPEAVADDAVDGYATLVRELARRAHAFGKPVLLLNGDSHLYESDRPLADPSGWGSQLYGVTVPVPNLVRVTVQGSTNVPHEWLRLHVDPQSADVFSWENVVF